MFSLQSFVNRIGRSNRENGHLVSESTHRSCGLAKMKVGRVIAMASRYAGHLLSVRVGDGAAPSR